LLLNRKPVLHVPLSKEKFFFKKIDQLLGSFSSVPEALGIYV
jgi:hypothetical protein